MTTRERAELFCRRFGMQVPILLAPMAGVHAPALSIAVANAGGMAACGALLLKPNEIRDWAKELRVNSTGPFQFNLWIPDPPPVRDADHEARVRAFLSKWGPVPAENAGNSTLPDFDEQCDTLLEVAPLAVSSVMGLFPPSFVQKMKAKGIAWLATASTVSEARAAEAAGADVIIAQGSEAGGHRGAFDNISAERQLIGLFSLIPAVVDAVKIPVVATGGIADGRGIAAALTLGASAVQIGTGFLRCPEAGIASAWAEALTSTAPEDTVVTRAFSGRAGRSILTEYVRATMAADAPASAPYPVQRGLTAPMRSAATKENDLRRIQAWAGQSAALAKNEPADATVKRLWAETLALLS